MNFPRFRTLALLVPALAWATITRADGPADVLLTLVPPDVGLTIAVEDLRGHVRSVFETPLVEGLARLPAVRAWRQSGDLRNLRHAIEKLETLLGTDFATMRDGLIGEAVVLTMRLPEGAPPDEARGLLLARVPDRPLLDRLIERVNRAQLDEGRLKRIEDLTRGSVRYHRRAFEGAQPDEYYAVLPGDIFAWSNSDDLVRSVIDPRARGSGLADRPAFRTVRQRLPRGPIVSLFVDAKFARRVMAAAPRPADAGGERLAAVVGRYLDAVDYAGAALVWNDGPVVHAHEVLDPARLPSAWKRWASRTEPIDERLSRVTDSALAVAVLRGDAVALLDVLRALTPSAQRTRFDNSLQALQGLMLGLDPREEIGPRLGPGMVFVLDRPESRPLPYVVSTQIATTPEGNHVAAAIENGLRTLLLLSTLDPKTDPKTPKLETRRVSGATVTTLGGRSTFAFSVHEGRLWIGSTPAAVTQALQARERPESGAGFRALRDRYAADSRNFALIDLDALARFAETHRAALIRRLGGRPGRDGADASRDLDQALGLVRLFRAGYFTSSPDPDLSGVHRTLGLVAQPRSAPAGR